MITTFGIALIWCVLNAGYLFYLAHNKMDIFYFTRIFLPGYMIIILIGYISKILNATKEHITKSEEKK